MSFLSGYITRRFAAIKQNLYGFAETKKQEHIHFLRVDIKKLRAVLAFLGKMNGKKKNPERYFGNYSMMPVS